MKPQLRENNGTGQRSLSYKKYDRLRKILRFSHRLNLDVNCVCVCVIWVIFSFHYIAYKFLQISTTTLFIWTKNVYITSVFSTVKASLERCETLSHFHLPVFTFCSLLVHGNYTTSAPPASVIYSTFILCLWSNSWSPQWFAMRKAWQWWAVSWWGKWSEVSVFSMVHIQTHRELSVAVYTGWVYVAGNTCHSLHRRGLAFKATTKVKHKLCYRPQL